MDLEKFKVFERWLNLFPYLLFSYNVCSVLVVFLFDSDFRSTRLDLLDTERDFYLQGWAFIIFVYNVNLNDY